MTDADVQIPMQSTDEARTLLGPLDPGRYTLRVSPHRRLPVEREVNVEAGRLSRVEVEARPGLRLEGMVNDARGRPLGGIDLNFWVKSAPGVLEHYVRAESDSDGRFVFEGLQAAPGDLEASDWAGWYEVWRESGATPGSPLAITLRDTARVTGRVEPAPSSRLLSYVLRTENSIAGAGDLALDADGRFVLHGLPAGIPIKLAFDPPNGQPALRELTPLARGEERDLGTIEVVAGGTFRGRIRDEAGKPFAWIRVRVELEKYTLIRCALTDQAGEFLVENMPRGRVVVFFMDQETSGRGYQIGDWSSKVHHEFELPR